MINRIFILMVFSILATACKQQVSKEENIEEYLVDKVWLYFLDKNDETPNQFYFNKIDGKRYIYSATEIKNDGASLDDYLSPWKKFKETPKTNREPEARETIYRKNYEGWREMEYFKVLDNMILYQDLKDVSGKELDTVFIEKGKDTLIGIFKYETLKTQRTDMIAGKPWHQTWVSKIK